MSWSGHTPSSLAKVMMTIEKGDRCSSPVHVHVDDTTPVHVHIKKPKKPLTSSFVSTADSTKSKLMDAKVKTAASFGDSNLRRSAGSSHSRSKSPSRTTWVPPPAKTSKGSKLAWQGPSHRLEITNPDIETLRMADLNTDDEDAVSNKMRQYEHKIDSLMNEVGTLKNEVELQKSMREIEKKDEILESSRRVLEEQEQELEEFRTELEATEKENQILRRNMEKLQSEADVNSTSNRDRFCCENDVLMNKLVEVELDGQAVAKQVSALRDVIRRLREEKRISSEDATLLTKQKQLLMQRLSDFEIANRTLRKILRDRHEQESNLLRLSEQRDLLLRKLSEMEDEVQRYRSQCLEKDRLLVEYRMQMESQKEENLAISSLQSSLEQTRAHLQKQLRQKDADCNRMAVQIRSLESQLAQEKIEVDHLRQLLTTAKEKAERDKEALKKATRVQKNRAAKSEDAVEHLNAQLMERDAVIAEQRSELDTLRARCDKLCREKAQCAAENAGLKIRLSELESLLEQLEEDNKTKLQVANARLHDSATEANQLKLENEHIKTSLSLVEEKLVKTESEIAQLRSSLRQYENLVEEYRSQMNKSRQEADETIIQLEEAKLEMTRTQQDGEMRLDEVKSRLQARLQELEPIPELLKTTELRLQDANEKLLSYERRNTENTKLIAELTAKVEHQSKELEKEQERYHTIRDDNQSLQAKLETLERKMMDLENQNKELLATIARREEAMHQANMRLDEKTRECTSLARQLEAALAEARRQSEMSREKTSSKDRATQSRILDLESQLSQARAEIARVKREKEEAERKFNSRLYDLKDRLEQSHSTNRSLQNYIQFLKNSYANVFGDTSLTLSSSPVRHNFH